MEKVDFDGDGIISKDAEFRWVESTQEILVLRNLPEQWKQVALEKGGCVPFQQVFWEFGSSAAVRKDKIARKGWR